MASKQLEDAPCRYRQARIIRDAEIVTENGGLLLSGGGLMYAAEYCSLRERRDPQETALPVQIKHHLDGRNHLMAARLGQQEQ